MSPGAATAGEVVFVLSDVRSGSTVLDQVLGAHEQVFSLGEVHWLRAYAREDRTLYDPVHPLLCSCGGTVSACPFWQAVADALGRPLDALELIPASFGWRGRRHRGRAGVVRHLPRHLLERVPAAFRSAAVRGLFRGERVALDSIALFDAVFRVTGRRYLVDSSKSPFRFRLVHALWPERVRVVFLARDYRAVVHSKMKRGAALPVAARSWRRTMGAIEALTADLPPERLHRLKYECLCAEPETQLGELCRFLGLDFDPAMLERPHAGIHHIGGSPTKFDPTRSRIELDRTYEGAFDPVTLARLRRLVGAVPDRWGY